MPTYFRMMEVLSCSMMDFLPYLLLVGLFTGFSTGAITAGLLRILPKATGLTPGK